MSYKLFIIWCFAGVGIMCAQHVQILDSNTKEPISGISVFNTSKSVFKISDLNGEVSLDYFSEEDDIIFKNLLYVRKRLSYSYLKDKKVIFLKRHVQGLNEVVVSASKFEQAQREVPQKVLQIKSDQIALMNPQTSADLLGYTGNVYIQKSQLGGGSPMIRGFSANRLLIIVDGVRMNNAIFRGGNLQNIISIDPFSVESSEVVLGSGAVIYGSDAIGGVMSFYTKRPKLTSENEENYGLQIDTRYASANQEKTGHLDFSYGGKKWGFLTSISYSDFSDLKMGKHGPSEYLRNTYVSVEGEEDVITNNSDSLLQKYSGYNQTSVTQKVRFQKDLNTFFDFGLYYSSTSNIPRYDRLIVPNGDDLKHSEWYYGPQKWFMSSLQYHNKSDHSILYDELHGTIAYQRFNESRHDRKFQETTLRNREEALDAVSVNLDFEKHISDRNEVFYGVEYLNNKVDSKASLFDLESEVSTPTNTRYPNNAYTHAFGVYTKLKIQTRSDLILQTGLRYSYLILKSNFIENNNFLNLPFDTANINSGALTGDFGLTYNISDNVLLKCNISSAYRAPNIDDVGKVFDSEPGNVVVPNPDLKPEYAYGVDAGFSIHLTDRIFIDLATFYTYLDNAMVRRAFNFNGQSQIIYDGELSQVQAIQNASHANIYGFEFGMKWQLFETLCLTSQFSLLDGTEDFNGVKAPVRHVAPAFGNAHLIFKDHKILVDVYVNYNDDLKFSELSMSEVNKPYLYALDENGNPYSPSWYTLNLKSEYAFNSKVRVSLGIENITNQRYRTYSSGIAAAGFNTILGLHYNL